jgi:hypothetical protein
VGEFYDRPLKKTPQFRSPQEPSTSIAAASGAFLSVIIFLTFVTGVQDECAKVAY